MRVLLSDKYTLHDLQTKYSYSDLLSILEVLDLKLYIDEQQNKAYQQELRSMNT